MMLPLRQEFSGPLIAEAVRPMVEALVEEGRGEIRNFRVAKEL